MATFPTPSQIQTDYFSILRSVKPSLNTDDKNSDFVIRGKTVSGVASGIYGDQAKVRNDTWIKSARPEALLLHGADLGIPQSPATKAQCPSVQIPGTNGTVVNPGDLTFLSPATGVLYTNTNGGTVTSGFVLLAVQCEVTGQIGNISSGATLTVVSPPAGIGILATLLADMADGSDIETIDSYRQRLLSRLQSPPAGGNSIDYPNFAFAADPSVRTALIKRFGRGLGTVDIYITTGTTDIDAAVTQGLPIVRIPSGTVLTNVQTYFDVHVPYCDCPRIFAPTELTVAVTVNVALAAGLTLSSVPADPVNNPLGLTVNQLIVREVGRSLYKVPVGGRLIPGQSGGFVVASDIEEDLDLWLSGVVDTATGFVIGKIPVLADRQVQKLNGANFNLPLAGNQLAKPGVITVVLGV